MSRVDFTFTANDIELTTEFMMLLGDAEYFNSDDFRRLGLHKRFSDPAHMIGGYFARLKANGVADPVGEIPSEIDSNNKRRVDLFRWNWQRWRYLIKTRLDYFTQLNSSFEAKESEK